MCHRIRESLREHNPGVLGGPEKRVEADEHKDKRNAKNIGRRGKEAVFALYRAKLGYINADRMARR